MDAQAGRVRGVEGLRRGVDDNVRPGREGRGEVDPGEGGRVSGAGLDGIRRAQLQLAVGDVQGKGLAAVPAAAAVLAAFRESAPVAPSLEAVGRRISCALVRRPEDRFVTAAVAELTEDGHLSVLNYGHPEPVILHTDGGADSADPDQPGMPLGLDTLARSRPGRYNGTLNTGDRILFHTDGLSEARDPSGTFYPVGACADLLRDTGLSTGLSRLRRDMKRHATRTAPEDDSALLLLEYAGASKTPPSPRRAVGDPGIQIDAECETCAVIDCPISTSLHHANS
ncbi:PP2C family protein-serine/threonine phosphatase [Streptomyces rubiginosohelvolus]|uniref:PP2C family protein-serine/threonine phosphatase n=1 Tax=Streptomyces rubiginosohelvolus TaxID=67362 RepID=UPI0033ABB502